MFLDTHAHLDFPEIYPQLDSVLANARLAQVHAIISVGIDAATNLRAVQIAEEHEEVYASVGWHPHDADKAGPDLEAHLKELSSRSKVVALGEVGLDYYRDHSDRTKQREVFARMVRLARELNRPLIVHCREAFDDVLDIIKREGQGEVRGVFHCFAGDQKRVDEVLDLDFLVSFTGNITYKNSRLIPVLQSAPIERLLLETDCPFMTPEPHRGKRNEPAHIPLIAAKIAEIKKLSVEDIARITNFNANKLFGIGEAPERKVVYAIRNSLYVALTSRCTNNCRFCPRSVQPIVKGHYIGMTQDQEPDFNEVTAAIGDPQRFDEVVFCGFGEPTIRFDLLLQVARWLKEKGVKTVRLDTNGQGDLINGRDVVPEMVGLIDAVSISLNEHRADLYLALVKSDFGDAAFRAVLEFARKCARLLPEVTLTVVSYPGVHIEASRAIADAIGAKFRVREYNNVG